MARASLSAAAARTAVRPPRLVDTCVEGVGIVRDRGSMRGNHGNERLGRQAHELLGGDRIRARVQLNLKDAFENGRLQPVAINPDGTYFAYRIIDPRRVTLSTSFDL